MVLFKFKIYTIDYFCNLNFLSSFLFQSNNNRFFKNLSPYSYYYFLKRFTEINQSQNSLLINNDFYS